MAEDIGGEKNQKDLEFKDFRSDNLLVSLTRRAKRAQISPSNTIAHGHITQRFVTRTRPARSRTRLQTHGPAILAGLRGPRLIMPDLAPALRLPET